MPAIPKTKNDEIYERQRRRREERVYASQRWVFAQGQPRGTSGAHVRVQRAEKRRSYWIVRTLCGKTMREVVEDPSGAQLCKQCLELSQNVKDHPPE